MPIHDQSYRHYRGERAAHGTRWLVITRAGILSLVRKRLFIVLMFGAWIPFIVGCVRIYLSVNFQQMGILAVKPDTFRNFLGVQGAFVFFITIFFGSGLIAQDRRANALQLYLAKPMTRAEYVAGKLAILMTLLLFITWVPAILLLIVQMAFSGSTQFIRQNLFLFPAITLHSMLQVTVAAFMMMALSSLSKSTLFVGFLYAGVGFFSSAIRGVLEFVTGNSSWAWVSPDANVEQLGNLVFRMAPKYDNHWFVSLIVVGGLLVVSMSILERRVRAVEVIT